MGSIHKLIIEDDEGKTTVVPVSRGEISIGRMEGNTIRLMERNVSRRHARLLRENGTVFIEDLNSFNGVKINGERIDKRIEIKEGDLVEIGDYHLALQAAHLEEDAAVARETAGPVLTQANTVPGGAGHPTSAPAQPAWQGAGAPTIPEFRPPEEVLAEARAEAAAQAIAQAAYAQAHGGRPPPASSGDTTRTFPPGSDPVVGPPVRPSGPPVLPPFPAAGAPGGGAPIMPAVPGLGAVPMPKNDAVLPKTEQIAVGAARLADVPRLVCVSTEYAGRDFPLTRPEIVIGRVEDNDVVIEHRSVSRNHAKIVFDGRVHKIIDLESANGILVNGEEYAITDLRKGDLIELGHVKFRFIPAGEPFVPNDEESRAMIDAGLAPAASPPRSSEITAPPGAAVPPPVPPLASASRPSAPATAAAKADPPRAPALMAQMAPPAHHDEPSGGQGVELHVGDDPSNAATVTDTPLSALVNVPELYDPKIDPGPTGARAEPADRRHEGRNGAAAQASTLVRRDEATHPEVVTTTNSGVSNRPVPRVSGASMPARHAPSKPATLRAGSDIEEPSRERSKVIAAALLVIIVVAVLIGGAIKMRDSGGTADRDLQAASDRNDCAKVQEIFDRNYPSRFEDKDKAIQTVALCREKYKQKDEVPPSEPVNVAPSGDHKTALAAAAVEDTDELPAGEVEDPHTAKAPAAPKPVAKAAPPPGTPVASNAAAGKKLERAKAYEREGRKALLMSDLARAEKLLTLCIQTYEYAPCHRELGILFASLNDSKRAISHYQRYVDLEPNADDAAKVKGMIKEARGGL